MKRRRRTDVSEAVAGVVARRSAIGTSPRAWGRGHPTAGAVDDCHGAWWGTAVAGFSQLPAKDTISQRSAGLPRAMPPRDPFMHQQSRVSIHGGRMGAARGRRDVEVVHRFVKLGPLPHPEVGLRGEHQAGAPELRRKPPRRGAEERLVEASIEGANLQFSAARISDPFQTFAELGGHDLRRGCAQDLGWTDAVDAERFNGSAAAKVALTGVAEGRPPDDLTLRVPPRVPDLNDPVGPRRASIVPRAGRLGVDDDHLMLAGRVAWGTHAATQRAPGQRPAEAVRREGPPSLSTPALPAARLGAHASSFSGARAL
jgi:hypothetical protein